MARRPKQLKGARAATFRRSIDKRLQAMGYSRGMYAWQTSPARLLIVIRGEMRMFQIHAGMRLERIEYEMGRLETWAEVLELKPRPTFDEDVPINGRQLDIEAAIRRTPSHAAAA